MDMKPVDTSIKTLLISGSQFSIPRFQREYSWDKKNYQEFIDDMLNCLTIEDGELKNQSYFLGTMLFIGDYDDKNNKDQHIDIVDGQQRITTITILFSALSDRFREINEHVLSEQVFRYIMGKDDDGQPYKVLVSKTHYPYFAFYIQDREKNDIQEIATEEEECIKESFIYLNNRLDEKNIKAYLKKNMGSDKVDQLNYIDILKALRDQILGSIFIAITTPDQENANMIFEILNAKGKKLSHVDLIKNKIFEVVDEEASVDYAEIKWSAIKNELVSRKEAVGLVTYYRHFWLSKYKKSTGTKLYDDFLKEVRPKTKARYKDFLLELENNTKDYMKIINPRRDDYDNKIEYFWLVQSLNALTNHFNIVQARVALLALYQIKDQDLISFKKFKEAIIYIENFHFAYNAITSGRSNKFETIYSKFAISLRKVTSKDEANKVIDTLLINPLSVLFPDFERFSKDFILLEFTKKPKPSNVKTKYAIQKLNAFFDKDEIFTNSGSIEHIIPDNSGEKSFNIGNLILLEQNLNNEAGALDYTTKRTTYKKSSYYWVKEFSEKHITWEEKDIEDRAKELAKIYYEEIFKRKI